MTYEKMYNSLHDWEREHIDQAPKGNRKFWIKRYWDEHCVGTIHYQGMAYFWGHAYKHTLRYVTDQERKATHRAWLDAGLELTGESPEHLELMLLYCKESIEQWEKEDSL